MDDTHHDPSLEELGQKMDVLGQQMNWLCENLASLFTFVNQMGTSGGGIRGIMHMLKQGPPELTTTDIPVDSETKVGA